MRFSQSLVSFFQLPWDCDVERDVLALVLSGFSFGDLPEVAVETNIVEHGGWLRFFCFVRRLRYMLAQRVYCRDPLSGHWKGSAEGTRTCYGAGVRTSQRCVAQAWKRACA